MICNAGMYKNPGLMRDTKMDDFIVTFNLNFFCPVVMTKEALPHLEKTKGNIVYVSSILGKATLALYIDPLHWVHACVTANSPNGQGGLVSAYGASKAALNYFAKAVNRQEASKGIRINILSPGVVVTPIVTPFVSVQRTGKFEINEAL